MSSPLTSLPVATQSFVTFCGVLRQHGFMLAPDQTMAFVESIALLGPRSIDDIYHAGLAVLAVQPDRRAEFDALFRAYFLGQTASAPTVLPDDEEIEAHESNDQTRDIALEDDDQEVGEQASTSENLSHRTLIRQPDSDLLRSFARSVPAALPRRRSRRYFTANRGKRIDLRQSLRMAVRRDGELFKLIHAKPKTRQRTVVLLVDVSGSMQDMSDETMRLAHALTQAADRVETFTLGTRLTRVTTALKTSEQTRALEAVSNLVADFDGGTRLGDALDALLSIPRFAALLRGAVVVIISDGLERGSPDMMVSSLRRMTRLTWQITWLSPLASGVDFKPRTEALQQALPYLGRLADGSTIEQLCKQVLDLSKATFRHSINRRSA